MYQLFRAEVPQVILEKNSDNIHIWWCLIRVFFQKLHEELENEDLDIPSHIREARFEELRKQAAEFEGMKDRHHGLYR